MNNDNFAAHDDNNHAAPAPYHQKMISKLYDPTRHKDMTDVDVATLYASCKMGVVAAVVYDEQGNIVNRGAHEGHFIKSTDRIRQRHNQYVAGENLPFQESHYSDDLQQHSFLKNIHNGLLDSLHAVSFKK